MNEIDFFNHMLERTKAAFLQSKTLEKYPNENWNYAICDTPIRKKTGIIFGLNWGGKDHNPQSKYPEAIKTRDWPFITHSEWYFKEFLHTTIDQLNYSNLCFFRSPSMNQIVKSDWDLAILLFKEYVEFIDPPWLLMLGKPVYLGNSYLTNKTTIKQTDINNRKNVYGYYGTLFNKYPIVSVPHPQARISTESRKDIWKQVIEKI